MAGVDAIWMGGFEAWVIRGGHRDDRIRVPSGTTIPLVEQAEATEATHWMLLDIAEGLVSAAVVGVDATGPYVDLAAGGTPGAVLSVVAGDVVVTVP